MLKEHMFEFYFDQMKELVFLVEVKNHHLYYKKMNKAAAKLVPCQGEVDLLLESVLPEPVYHFFYPYCMKAVETKKPVTSHDINIFSDEADAFETTFTPIFNDTESSTHIVVLSREIDHLQQKEEEYLLIKSFMDHTVDTIIIADQHDRIIKVNQAFEHMFEWSGEEMVGKHLANLPIIPDTEKAAARQMIQKVKRGEQINLFETTRLTRSGEIKIISMGCSPIKNAKGAVVAYALTYKDMTELKQLKKELAQSLEQYKSLFMNHENAICMMDLSGKIIQANPACEQIFGYDNQEIANSSYKQILKELKIDPTTLPQQHIIYDQSYSKEIKAWHKEKGTIYLYVTNVPIVVENEWIGIYLIAQDVTKEKVAEKKLENTVKDLANMKYALDESAIVSILDPHGTITYVNDMFCTIFGYKQEELLGQSYELFDVTYDLQTLENIGQGKVWRGQVKSKTKEGVIVWSHKTIVPLTDIHQRISSYVLIQTDITAQKKLENQLKFKAFHDSLTGVPNRMMLQKQVQSAIEQRERFGLLFLDCDNFKEVNDQFGHDIGDAFLIQYAHRLTSCIRTCDEVYRLGGDEFVILLRQVERQEEIQRIMERIHRELQKEWTVDARIFTATSTIGAAYYPDNGASFQELLKQADQALYEGKRQGKNNVNFYKQNQPVADFIDEETIV